LAVVLSVHLRFMASDIFKIFNRNFAKCENNSSVI